MIAEEQIAAVRTEFGRSALSLWLYELASVEAALGEKDEALASLKESLDLGYIGIGPNSPQTIISPISPRTLDFEPASRRTGGIMIP